ncbi:MAG: Holliday junction resolvase RuvX [Planctomycetes bacterium]|nr:Holliday junction resolvase RuvX [Planctomycetota bacterium]
MDPARVLAVDHGSVRLGLAISDPTGTVAHPLEVVEGEAAGIERIAALVAERGVGEVVVGLPKNMDGSLGPQARDALAFAARLGERLGFEILTWDERLTSAQADQALTAGHRERSKARGKRGRGPLAPAGRRATGDGERNPRTPNPEPRRPEKRARLSREDRQVRRDKVAASILLQSYLDARARGRRLERECATPDNKADASNSGIDSQEAPP